MAKAPFWLRGGKGKLAGSVLFKGEKGTIIRENVVPRNVQSDPQMRQRIAFGTVTQAAREMLPIIGISFEGYDSEKLNRRRFVQVNSTFLGKKAKINATECAWSTKGNNQLIPNPYIMSAGSLDTPEILQPFFNNAGTALIPNMQLAVKDTNITFPKKVMSPLELWSFLYGIGAGGQITAPMIKTLKGATHFADFEDTIGDTTHPVTIKDYIRYSKFEAPRVVLKNADEIRSGYDVDFTQDEENMPSWQDDIRYALDEAVDKDKSDSNFLGFLLANDSAHARETLYQVELDWSAFDFDTDWQVSAIGIILSRRRADGSYTYNNCKLLTGHTAIVAGPSYYGVKLPFAYQSYLSAETRSQNYLQTGGSGGNI